MSVQSLLKRRRNKNQNYQKMIKKMIYKVRKMKSTKRRSSSKSQKGMKKKRMNNLHQKRKINSRRLKSNYKSHQKTNQLEGLNKLCPNHPHKRL